MPELDAQAFADLAAELHEAPTVNETAQQVVTYALSELDATHGGITLIRQGRRLETVAPSASVVSEIDRLQYRIGEGVCIQSDWEGETLAIQSMADSARWPRWGRAVADLGVSSMLSTELPTTDGRRMGTLNLYWAEARVFGREDLAFAQIFGRHASLAMSAIMTESDLRVALDSRKRIGQAQGILMERFGLNEDQAFQVLRRYSQDHNEKLRVIADRLVSTRLLPSQEAVPNASAG